ncbi:MAG: CpaF family protein [Caldilineaceae bacterium]|nr:CpaF family protein [Caldilineaceae bacterium]MBP8108751.1 CpaF family protein [Caldilineaceae bacterium]MBP8121536.1 CpaF family protein [Caldilineaceae bacterium]MBP9071429.1 CpaF family protein [Caldilineaceae bacterium]
MSWTSYSPALTPEQSASLINETCRDLAGLPLSILRNRRELGKRADLALQTAARRLGLPTPDSQAILAQVLARVGGLGFLDGLMPPNASKYTDLLLNADGSVWGRPKGSMAFDKLDLHPSPAEAWRTVEALLAPQGRACTEATPTVDAKLPRDKELGFGGARVKVVHPAIASGDGYPAIALRLFEPTPVKPQQIVEWGVFPQVVMDGLLAAVAGRLRILVVGGTATGKTTLLSALCHGIDDDARIVKVEDPEEIWLPHPNVTTLEARPAPPGSDVPAYTVSDGVDDAMRLAPSHVIVGEVRTGNAALSLFRALMSDHAGLTTFHAEGPEEAVFRLGVILFADAGVKFEAAKGLFAQAIDLVVQVGWREGKRVALGVWEVVGLSGSRVEFRALWSPSEEEMAALSKKRR